MAQEFKHTISLGYGFPNLPKMAIETYNSYQDKDNFISSGFGPLHLKYEYMASNRLGITGSINHIRYTISYTERYADTFGRILPNSIQLKQNRTAVNARLNYHILDPENHTNKALYFGLGFGYNFGKKPALEAEYPDGVVKILSIPPLMIRLSFEATLGYRYYFNESVALYTEIGTAKSLIQAGACVRF